MSRASTGTFLGFDYGSQSIGVAAGSAAAGVCTPLSAIRVFRSGPDWAGIDRLVEDWRPVGFVVGVALNSRGGDTASSRRARKFGNQLRGRYNRPVHWMDETLSSEAARRSLREIDDKRQLHKEDIDNTAAALILDSFLVQQR